MPTLDELLESLDSFTFRLAYYLNAEGGASQAKPFAAFSSRATLKQLNALPPAERAAEVLAIVDKVAKTRRGPETRVACKYSARTAKAIVKIAAKEAAGATVAKTKAKRKSTAKAKPRASSKGKR